METFIDWAGLKKMNKVKEHLLGLIALKYGDLEHRNYDFVLKDIESDPYQGVASELAKFFDVDKDTDPNEDVSFGYLLSGKDGSKYYLRISMVGPFAFLIELKGVDFLKIIEKEFIPNKNEEKIVNVFASCQIQLLGMEILDEKIKIGDEFKSFFDLLFVNDGVPPWRT